ncbi:hypothetical protein M406DRAFT_32919 [Cryphonectria parasitica EP155]|uniref:O-methyltransferase domain-containing protein n=1 Tax=Cryphonectria parasitica (strain ATCC 38755 / EP155) TaxID=660469 RepID=A0A9P4YDM4_CRYP1|nr:uncharacterized protein M406DRAFT_32919 [Cryphonectria parasitica EP155]KAF3771418.1 hypothetical protein M406DRAFT_32919 [Cryphonectria parasitica EP155]
MRPYLTESLHSNEELPDKEIMVQAARSVDLLHRVQLLLDSPTSVLADHFLGYIRSQCLLGAVQRRVPDALDASPLPLEELARATHSRSDRLSQILRILCSAGIFNFDDSTGLYSNSPASSLLLTAHWTQWHNWVTLYNAQLYDIARGIPASLGRDSERWAAQINYDTDEDMFSCFRRQGWVPQLRRTLGGGAAAQMPGILEDYPWEEVANGLIIDIGGGSGSLIAGLARKYPTLQGGIYDLPYIIDHARPFSRDDGPFSDVKDQFDDSNLIAGDFFKSIPPCAVYTMKWCLHDWKEPQAVVILKKVWESIVLEPKSRLVVLEFILSNDHSSRLSQYGDINMMMTANGQERTEEQWRALAELAGFRIEKIWDFRRSWVKALDFRPILDKDC